MLPPGEELDALVLGVLRNRKVVGRALCIPVGPKGVPLYWEVVAPESGPMHPGAELRNVYVARCECGRDTYEERVAAEARGERIAGHRLDCLKAVPRFSIDQVAALQIWRRLDSVEISKNKEEGETPVSVTIYDSPGAFAQGTDFAHALSQALVALNGRS